MNHPLCPDPTFSEYDPIQENCYNPNVVIMPPTSPITVSPSAVPDLLFGAAIAIALMAMFLKKVK